MNRINLIPVHQRQPRTGRLPLPVVVGVSMGGVALLALAFALLLDHLHEGQVERNAALAAWPQDLQGAAAQVSQVQGDINRLEARLALLEALGQGQGRGQPRLVAWAVLQELSRLTPPGLVLTALRQEEDKLHLSGVALSHEHVVELMSRLERGSPLLQGPEWVELRSLAGDPDAWATVPPRAAGRVEFTVAAWVRPADAAQAGLGAQRDGGAR